MKIVINNCYGAFYLSHDAIMAYAKRKGMKLYAYIHPETEDGATDFDKYVLYKKNKKYNPLIYYSKKKLAKNASKIDSDSYFSCYSIARNDPDLVAVVKSLRKKADTEMSRLKIVNIPDDVDWDIGENAGIEWIYEKHRRWQ